MSQNDSTTCSEGDSPSDGEVYSILWLQSSQLNTSTSGDYALITVNGSVAGAQNNWNWPHFCGQTGQSGFGVEDNTTTVICGSDCTDNSNGVNLGGISDVLCNSTNNMKSPDIYCKDYSSSSDYDPTFNATFSGALSYTFEMQFGVRVPATQTGSALIYSIGTHLQP